ncbi:unnamed protein product [Eruca vesicaria subsp. sativa]|uniref:Uncharacterized protein n=1 Tax=Eruca vesicaria subsp. sativa TaxID=29727 RepID=A0ABC8KQV9_ERUVS|nr:unnamed protein product [Eruca vesicaria subsp. sativa]
MKPNVQNVVNTVTRNRVGVLQRQDHNGSCRLQCTVKTAHKPTHTTLIVNRFDCLGAGDKTFEFNKKRNRPERYDRNVTEDTLKAIKKIDKIRSAREADHINKRLKPNKQKVFKSAVADIDQHINFLRAPGSQQQDSEKMKVLVSGNKSVQNEAMERVIQ